MQNSIRLSPEGGFKVPSRLGSSLAAAALVMVPAASSSGAILISDDFNSVNSGTSINGRTPPTTTGSAAWIAPSSAYQGNGAGALSTEVAAATTASLDMGANTFSNVTGVYELSVDITQPTVGSPGSSWAAVGFARANASNDNLVGNNGNPWMLYRINGAVNVYAGPATNNVLISLAAGNTTAPTGTPHTFKLQLDTSTPNWTLNAFVDTTQLDLNGASAGLTYTFTTNPTLARYVAMATGSNGAGGIATLDNFVLSGPVPEPGIGLVGLGAIALLSRRARQSRS